MPETDVIRLEFAEPAGFETKCPAWRAASQYRDELTQRRLVADQHHAFAPRVGPNQGDNAGEVAAGKRVGVFDIRGDIETSVHDLRSLPGAQQRTGR